MSAEMWIAAFLILDASLVVAALLNLSRHRSITDITDMRYHKHPDRARRTTGNR